MTFGEARHIGATALREQADDIYRVCGHFPARRNWRGKLVAAESDALEPYREEARRKVLAAQILEGN